MNTSFCHYNKLGILFLLTIILIIGCGKTTESRTGTGAIEPEDALATFELAQGFKIELLASEPLISDPVDMVIDEYGRLYVVEMHGYPLDKSGAGTIKLLTDTNGDGKMDKATIFADGLTMPMGIMRWKKGVIVTDAPQVLYLEDTNGDGKADVREIMLTGFAFSNAQMNVSNPVYGLDNWIYLTSESGGTYQNYNEKFGYMGDDIYFPVHPEAPRLPMEGAGRTVRFRPDSYALELTSGVTQFGHTFDVWGHHILGDNSNHIYHEVIAAPYLKRNPDLLVSDATQTLTNHGSKVFPITRNPEHQLLTKVGVFTSACGNTAYTGGAFPAPYDKNVYFVAEPVSNLIHVDRLKSKGASFVASRLRPEKEFLASTDAWFRPVNMYVGPDGALYVVDYYRQIIEHPEWMSQEAIEAGGLYNGSDMGRIYRITPTDAKPAAWTKGLQLGDATDKELVAELANPNRWWRLNAQRLLVSRGSKQAVPALVQMAKNDASPMGRLHALWTLEGLGELTPTLIRQALEDTVPGIRENAIKLAELHLSTSPGLAKALLALQDDPNPKVRFQLLCTLGFIDTPQAAQARNNLLFRDLSNKWVQIAALSTSFLQQASLLKTMLNNFHQEVPAYASLVERLSAMVGSSGEPGTIHQLIKKATSMNTEKQHGWKVPVLEGLARGLEGALLVSEHDQNLLVKTFFKHPSDKVRKASLQILEVTGIQDETVAEAAIKKALTITKARGLPDEKRTEAIRFMALYNPAPHASLLKKLIAPQEPLSIQLEALKILSLIPDQTVSRYVLQQWSVLTPAMHDAALRSFLLSPDRVRLLLGALEAGKVQKASVDFSLKVQLMTYSDETLSSRARAIFAKDDEKKVNTVYQQVLELEGDAVNGKIVFQRNCARCHQNRGKMGIAFGPDLGTVHSWEPETIMAHILSPNLSIATGYDLWTVELDNGKTIRGIISSETPSAITLRSVGGAERMIDRQAIKSLKALNISAMPTGFEKQINPQEMADLLDFLGK